MKRVLTLTILLILSIQSFAQITIDTATAKNLSETIFQLVKKGQIDSAQVLIPVYFNIFEPAITHQDSIQWKYAKARVADHFRKNGYPIIALPYYQKALQFSILIHGNTHSYVGIMHYNLGYCYVKKGFYDEAIQDFTKAANIFKVELGETHGYVISSYIAIANAYSEILDNQKAFTFYQHALSIYQTAYDNSGNEKPRRVSISQGRIYNNLGEMHADLGEVEKAIEYYNDALFIYRKYKGEDIEQSLIYTFFNIAQAYIQINQFEDAYGYLAVVKQYQEENSSHPIDLGETYNILSLYYDCVNQHNLAKFYSKKAIEIFHNAFGQKHPFLIEAYNQYGKVLEHTHQLDSALMQYEKAIASSLAVDYINPQDRSDVEITGLATTKLFEAFYSLARTLQSRYVLSNETSDLIEALHICKNVDKIAQYIRVSLQYSDQILLSENLLTTYQLGVSLSYLLYENTKDEQYRELLNFFSEKKKVAALSSIITSVRAKNLGEIPEHLLKKERELASRLNFFNTEIQILKKSGYVSIDAIKLNNFYDSLFIIREAYDKLIDEFEREHEKYYQLKHNTDIITSRQVQSLLDEETLIISYAMDDKNIYITTITDTSFQVIRQPKDTYFDLDASVLKLHKLLQKKTLVQKRHRDKFIKNSHLLYQNLIAPIKNQIEGQKKLIIIPEGTLHYLPFEVLLSSDNEIDFQKMPYLIKDYEILYHYSISLYSDFTQKANYKSPNALLAVAPVFDEDSTQKFMVSRQYGALVWSKKEVEYIEHLFKTKSNGFNTNILLREEATEQQFKNLIRQHHFNNIHISTHGEANEMTPDLSWIAFFIDKNEICEDGCDGHLYASEVFDFQLKTNLLVLSSCESGLGKLSRGEGMISINRGFLYAGALNIVYSVWKINDRYTYELMTGFYKNLFDNQTYATALRQSKLDMIEESPISALPTNWAGFLLIGQ